MVGQPQQPVSATKPWATVKPALKLPAKDFVPKAVQPIAVQPIVVEKPIEKPVDKVVENLKKLEITDEEEITQIK